MAVQFIQAVNATLKRVRVIQGDAGELGTSTVTSTATGLIATDAFTDSGRQVQIDLAIQLWQEATHEVQRLGLYASFAASATLVLVADQREYSTPIDFEGMAGLTNEDRVLRGATTLFILHEYHGGYARMLRDQPNATDFTGDPQAWARSPVNGNIRIDREPTAQQDGDTYNYLYNKRVALTSTMATVDLPYSNSVADALVPVVAEAWNRVMKKEFDSGLFQASLTRSLEFLLGNEPRERYGKTRRSHGIASRHHHG